MSLQAVARIAAGLPRAIAEDVVGYARCVDASLSGIFHEAGIAYDEQTAQRVVFIAGLKKLRAIISMHFWTLDNSLHLIAKSGISSVRMGSLHVSQGSEYHLLLRAALDELEEILELHNLSEIIDHSNFADIARALRDEY